MLHSETTRPIYVRKERGLPFPLSRRVTQNQMVYKHLKIFRDFTKDKKIMDKTFHPDEPYTVSLSNNDFPSAKGLTRYNTYRVMPEI